MSHEGLLTHHDVPRRPANHCLRKRQGRRRFGFRSRHFSYNPRRRLFYRREGPLHGPGRLVFARCRHPRQTVVAGFMPMSMIDDQWSQFGLPVTGVVGVVRSDIVRRPDARFRIADQQGKLLSNSQQDPRNAADVEHIRTLA